jgi:hypothetical protein
MSISIANIWRTQVIVGRTTIEKIILDVSMKMLDNYIIETRSPNNRKTIIGIPIAKRPKGVKMIRSY